MRINWMKLKKRLIGYKRNFCRAIYCPTYYVIPYLSNMVSYDDHILRVEQLSTIVEAHLSDNADLSRLKLITVLGHLDIVKLILEVQPDLIRQGDDFYQTILLAVQARNTPLVTYFIEQHAEIDIETTNKLLFMAKEYQYPDLAMLLFKKEADLTKDSHIEKRKSQEPNLESTNEIQEVKKQKGSDDELIEQGKGKKRKYNDLIADAEENKDEVAETKDKQHPNKKRHNCELKEKRN